MLRPSAGSPAGIFRFNPEKGLRVEIVNRKDAAPFITVFILFAVLIAGIGFALNKILQK
jgi:hypothetical protein